MNLRHFAVALLASAGLVSGTALAVDNPDKIAGGTIVTAAQAKELIAKGVMVVDARSAAEYAEQRIKGAKSVPYKEKSTKVPDFDGSTDSFDLSKLPADKGAAMIFYCNGLDCWKSYKAATTAIRGGYTNVKWLRGGMPEWKASGGAVE